MAASLSVFEHSRYRSYLLNRLGQEGTRTGLRKKAAEAMKCHPTLLSQVLNDRVELSFEQAESLNLFLRHSDSEAEYFLLLVQKERAATSALKRRVEKRISEVLAIRNQISERIPKNQAISELDRDEFYRSWLYGALHVLVSIPDLQKVPALAEALKLPKEKIEVALSFLIKLGLVTEIDGRYQMGEAHIHLKNTAPQISQHHRNWRFQAIQSLEHPSPEDLHYSGAVTVSKRDADALRERFLQFLNENIEFIKASPSEEGYVMAFDFFRIA